MKNKKQKQILHIGGGDSYGSREDFFSQWKKGNFDLHSEEFPLSWPHNMQESLGDDFDFIRLSFPLPKFAKYEEWLWTFEKYLEQADKNIIITAWSQGGIFILKYLSENDIYTKFGIIIDELHLISSLCVTEDDIFDPYDYSEWACDVEKVSEIQKSIEEVSIYHSEDDTIISFSYGENLSKILPKAKFISFKDRWHFVSPDFPEIVDNIMKNNKTKNG